MQQECDPLIGKACACGESSRTTMCSDCVDFAAVCSECFIKIHKNSPFHWARVWNPDAGFFVQKDISMLRGGSGYAITIGHGGESCPLAHPEMPCSVVECGQQIPQSQKSNKEMMGIAFTVVHTNGIHGTRLHFCGCFDDVPRRTQLVRARLFPGSTRQPLTAFTIPLLRSFRLHSLQSKCSAQDFLSSLQRMTDNVKPQNISVCRHGPCIIREGNEHTTVSNTSIFKCNSGVEHNPDSQDGGSCPQHSRELSQPKIWGYASLLSQLHRDRR